MKYLAIFIFAILLYACGDSVQYSDSENHKLSEKIFVVPETSNYNLEALNPTDTVFIPKESSARIRVAAFLDNNILDSTVLPYYYFFRFWNYGENNYTTEHITVQADSTRDKACVYSIDFFADTTVTCVQIVIDNPFELEAITPIENESPVDLNSVKFKVKATGIDAWETAECNLFISTKINDIKNKAILKHSFDCNEEQEIELEKISDFFYWMVTAHVYSSYDTTIQSTEPRRFFAKPHNNKPVAILPIQYERARSKPKSGIVTIAQGDSTIEQFEITGDTLLYINNLNSGIAYTATVKETLFTDYVQESLEFTIQKNAYTMLDTIKLKDVIAPEALPLKPSFTHEESIQFYIAENGSGINALRTAITISGITDTIPYRYKDSKISFNIKCQANCYAFIHLEDNAQNRIARKHWKLSFDLDSIRVTGPFISEIIDKTENAK